MPLGIYASYGTATTGFPDGDSYFNNKPNDQTALGILGQLSIFPNKANIFLAYARHDNGDETMSKTHSFTYGVQYLLTPNICLELYGVKKNGSAMDALGDDAADSKWLIQLFAGF
jgi:predicted porin